MTTSVIMNEPIDPLDAALDAQLSAARALQFKLSEKEAERARKAREIEAEYKRADHELAERLQAEADVALATVRAELQGRLPIDAMWSVEAFKLCGIGWLVLGPGDHGYAIEAMKASGSFDPNTKALKVIERDIDVMLPVVQKAILKAPVELKNYDHVLTKVPHFVSACYGKIQDLGGAGAKEAREKLKR